jgi:hypothetical protein
MGSAYLAIGMNEKNGELIHAGDVLSNQFGQLVSQQRSRLAPILVAKRHGMIAQFEQQLMLLSVTDAKRAAGSLHQRGLMIEMVTHQLFEPCDKKWKLDLFAIDGAKPPIRNRPVVKIDGFMTERLSSSYQRA